MNDPSLEIISATLSNFMDAQKEHNKGVMKNIDKLVDTMATLNTVHVEIKNLSAEQSSIKNDIHLIEKDIKTMNDKVLTNSIQAEEYKWVKRIVVSFFLLTALGGGYMTKTSMDNSAQQTASMAELVKAIKSNQSK